MVYQECKYRMPCGWCDRHNRLCDIVHKRENKKLNNKQFSSDCYPSNMAELNDLAFVQSKISLAANEFTGTSNRI